MRKSYPLFQSHLDVAHDYWRKLDLAGEVVIDATCGNGRDSLKLAQLALKGFSGELYALDLQADAIENTQKLLRMHLEADQYQRVKFSNGCHSSFPIEIQPQAVKLIVYNLGYLPGGDKKITTSLNTTLKSIQGAMGLLKEGGVICITCYPGHSEGKNEEEQLVKKVSAFNPQEWCCTHQCWLNRRESPSLLVIQKGIKSSAP
jgi:SAM-dependent methyltransferase